MKKGVFQLKNTFDEVMEKIEKENKLEKLLKMESTKEVYDFLRENGYSKSEGEFKIEMEKLLKDESVNLEDAELDQVAGGTSKNSLRKLTSAGMASLLVLGASPISSRAHASTPYYFSNSQNELIQRLVEKNNKKSNTKKIILAALGIGGTGIVLTGAGIGAYALYKKSHKGGSENTGNNPPEGSTVQPSSVHEESIEVQTSQPHQEDTDEHTTHSEQEDKEREIEEIKREYEKLKEDINKARDKYDPTSSEYRSLASLSQVSKDEYLLSILRSGRIQDARDELEKIKNSFELRKLGIEATETLARVSKNFELKGSPFSSEFSKLWQELSKFQLCTINSSDLSYEEKKGMLEGFQAREKEINEKIAEEEQAREAQMKAEKEKQEQENLRIAQELAKKHAEETAEKQKLKEEIEAWKEKISKFIEEMKRSMGDHYNDISKTCESYLELANGFLQDLVKDGTQAEPIRQNFEVQKAKFEASEMYHRLALRQNKLTCEGLYSITVPTGNLFAELGNFLSECGNGYSAYENYGGEGKLAKLRGEYETIYAELETAIADRDAQKERELQAAKEEEERRAAQEEKQKLKKEIEAWKEEICRSDEGMKQFKSNKFDNSFHMLCETYLELANVFLQDLAEGKIQTERIRQDFEVKKAGFEASDMSQYLMAWYGLINNELSPIAGRARDLNYRLILFSEECGNGYSAYKDYGGEEKLAELRGDYATLAKNMRTIVEGQLEQRTRVIEERQKLADEISGRVSKSAELCKSIQNFSIQRSLVPGKLDDFVRTGTSMLTKLRKLNSYNYDDIERLRSEFNKAVSTCTDSLANPMIEVLNSMYSSANKNGFKIENRINNLIGELKSFQDLKDPQERQEKMQIFLDELVSIGTELKEKENEKNAEIEKVKPELKRFEQLVSEAKKDSGNDYANIEIGIKAISRSLGGEFDSINITAIKNSFETLKNDFEVKKLQAKVDKICKEAKGVCLRASGTALEERATGLFSRMKNFKDSIDSSNYKDKETEIQEFQDATDKLREELDKFLEAEEEKKKLKEQQDLKTEIEEFKNQSCLFGRRMEELLSDCEYKPGIIRSFTESADRLLESLSRGDNISQIKTSFEELKNNFANAKLNLESMDMQNQLTLMDRSARGKGLEIADRIRNLGDKLFSFGKSIGYANYREHEGDFKDFQKKVDELGEDLKKAIGDQERARQAGEEKKRMLSEKRKLSDDIDGLKEKIYEFETARGNNEELRDQVKSADELNKRLWEAATSRDEILKLRGDFEKLKDKFETYREVYFGVEELTRKVNEMREESTNKNVSSETKQRVSVLMHYLSSLKSSISRYSDRKNYEKKAESLKRLQAEFSEIDKLAERELQELKEGIEKLREEISQMQNEKGKSSVNLSDYEVDAGRLAEELSKLQPHDDISHISKGFERIKTLFERRRARFKARKMIEQLDSMSKSSHDNNLGFETHISGLRDRLSEYRKLIGGPHASNYIDEKGKEKLESFQDEFKKLDEDLREAIAEQEKERKSREDQESKSKEEKPKLKESIEELGREIFQVQKRRTSGELSNLRAEVAKLSSTLSESLPDDDVSRVRYKFELLKDRFEAQKIRIAIQEMIDQLNVMYESAANKGLETQELIGNLRNRMNTLVSYIDSSNYKDKEEEFRGFQNEFNQINEELNKAIAEQETL